MSRCYPFPPPGYVKKECLIESIKGAKEEVKKDRKHKKKEKKRKERDNEAGRSKKHRHKRQRNDDEVANVSNKVDDHCELINTEVELLEKSCITVELELQTSSQTSCDSTLHSNERPKQSQSQSQLLDGRHNDSGEFVCVLLVLGLFASTCSMVTFFLQICCYGFEETGLGKRLSGTGQKDFEAEVMITNKDQKRRQGLDFGRAHSTSANEASRDALRVCQGKRKDPIFDSRDVERKLSKEKKPMPLKDNRKNSKEKMPSSSSHQETVGPSNPLCRKCPPSMAVQFLNLIENWTPDRFESNLTNSEDQEWWWFMNFGTKRHQVCNQNTEHRSSSSTLWPTALFLPEAEVHALPFTVPY